MLQTTRQEWQCFRHDVPGRRFSNHYNRAHRSASKAHAALRGGLGVLLFVAGVIMLFIPGPGLLAMLFGVALIAGESGRVAGILDRGELRARRRWKRATRALKVAILASAGLIAAAVTAVMAWGWLT